MAFLDIMGFSDFVFRNTHGTVSKRMQMIKETIDKVNHIYVVTEEVLAKSNKLPSKKGLARTITFSDSILIFSKDDKEDSIDFFLAACQDIFLNLMVQGIPLKGCITFGEITADFENSLFYGKPLIDAYNLHEELQFYGVIMDHNAESSIKSNGLDIYCKQHRVPMKKSGLTNHMFLDWTAKSGIYLATKTGNPLDATKNIEASVQIINRMYSQMSGYPRKYLDNTIDLLNKL